MGNQFKRTYNARLNIISNNLRPNTNTTGIAVYVKQDLLCKQINYDCSFSEFILLEIACKEYTKLTFGIFIEAKSVAYCR